jgi:GWxTD domain-containing protein
MNRSSIGKRLLFILPVWLLVPAAAGQAVAAGFVLHASAFIAARKTPSVRVTAEIAYSNLVFLKEDGVFRSRYSLAVTIRSQERDNEIVRTGVINGDAVAENYEETHSREKRSRPSREFALPPGEYTVEGVLSVKNTHIRYQRITRVIVPDFLASGIGFGTPEVLYLPSARGHRIVRWDDFERRADVRRTDGEMIGLNVLDAQPAVRFELFLNDDVPMPFVCSVHYEVRRPDGVRMLYGRGRVSLGKYEDTFLLTFDAGAWPPGQYAVNLHVSGAGGKLDARAGTRLSLDVTRAMLDEYFEDTMEILALIATESELQALDVATAEMREQEWREFWRRRDPEPSTPENEALEELLKRVRYASENYARYGKAWKTDRGKVYIRYGRPDRVERTPDQVNQGEYEIWHYDGESRSFVFFATYAGGQYRLVEEYFQ